MELLKYAVLIGIFHDWKKVMRTHPVHEIGGLRSSGKSIKVHIGGVQIGCGPGMSDYHFEKVLKKHNVRPDSQRPPQARPILLKLKLN